MLYETSPKNETHFSINPYIHILGQNQKSDSYDFYLMLSHGLKSPRKNCAFRVLPKALRQTMPQQKIASTSILPLDTERNLFFTVTDNKMRYLAMNVRQNLGFHQSLDDCIALGGTQLGLITLSSWHSCRVHVFLSKL